jgi:hypothetical protein
LSGLEFISIHRDAHAASGLAPFSSRFAEYSIQPFGLGGFPDVLRTRDDDDPGGGIHFAAFEKFRGRAQIGKPAVRAAPDKYRVDLVAENLRAWSKPHVIQGF